MGFAFATVPFFLISSRAEFYVTQTKSFMRTRFRRFAYQSFALVAHIHGYSLRAQYKKI